MIDRNQIEGLGPQPREPRVRSVGNFNREPTPSERALGETAQAVVVIDVKDPRRGDDYSTSGTWITARNRPS